MELGMVVPDLQRDDAGGIGKIPLEIGLAAFRLLFGALLDLSKKRTLKRGLAGGG